MSSLRDLPDLKFLFERETHVGLYFDNHPSGKCLLAVGARRSFVWEGDDSQSLGAFDRFLHPNGASQWSYGWIGYDLKNGIESLKSQRKDALEIPSICWMEPRIVIEWGCDFANPEIVFGHDESDAQELLEAVNTGVTNLPKGPGVQLSPRWSESTYLQKAHRVKKHIQRGDIYEMNLCQEWTAKVQLERPWDVFVRLHHLTQSPYSAYIKAGEFQVLCGSPELFLNRRGNVLTSSPIKGTIRRGQSEEEDNILARQLQDDPKERGENVMICDLVRNDLSRVAKPGTVHVPELFGIHRFQSVHQMISTVRCEQREDCSVEEILRATFPMGSMTGAPKIRAMEIIDELEASQRGVYSGSIGFFKPDGSFDLNVVIRSLVYNDRIPQLSMHVGGAITALSEPHKEYEECLLKAQAILKALDDES